MAIRSCVGIIVFLVVVPACAVDAVRAGPPDPLPRDIETPDELPPDLGRVRILWTSTALSGGSTFTLLNPGAETAEPLPTNVATIEASPSGRFYVIATDLFPGGDIEVLDRQTGERRVLVSGKERFPGAALGFPSFSPDETSVAFELAWGNRIDVALADLDTGKVQFLDLGGFNQRPRFSPDKTLLLVVCEQQATAGLTLCLLDRERRVRVHFLDDSVATNGMFTPDGRAIVYIAIVGGVFGEGRLYRIGVDGKAKELLVANLYAGSAVLGVTPESAVFTCRYPSEPACSWVCTIGLDGGNAQRLTYLGAQCVDVEP